MSENSGEIDNPTENPYFSYVSGDRWELPTLVDGKLFDATAGEFRQRLLKAGWNDDESRNMEIGFREALINAIIHGNLDIHGAENNFDAAREKLTNERVDLKVIVELKITSQRVEVKVTDQGKGYDPAIIADPTSNENVLKASGRGIMLMESFFDSADYINDDRQLVLIKEKK
jgi:anti-sigma regulatory factor (Ser/Thr protein kinase)